ncbi:MAG TPA: DnaB-like helicase N-terminal domain-containing protein, partial [Polyangiales bacterium]|nr:DnaB-like helicase N-terminal domain-containing protein [Polyangiales bacterium]
MLLDNSTFRAARDSSLAPLHFSTEPHRFTYEAIVELQERGVPVDEITLTEALRRKGQLERVGGSEFLRALSDTIPSMARAQELARSVRSASTLRSTLRTLRHFIQKAHEGHGGDAAEFLRRASNALSQLGDPDSPPMATLRDKEPQRSAPLSKPYSEEAERAVLASIVLNAKSSPGVMDTLSKDDFYVESHALAFESLRSLRERGAAPDTAGLREELQTRGALKRVGGDEFLLGLTDKIPPTANLETHARIVRDLAQVRRAIDLLQTAEQRVLWDRDLEASSFLQQTAAALRDMAHERSPQATREVGRGANSSVGQPQVQSQPATAHPEVVAAFGHVPTIAEIAAVGRASPSPVLDDREVLSMLEAAEGRLRVLEEESARQRNQGLAEHKANGAPPLPQDPTRKEWLQEQVAARENRTAVPPRFRQNLVRLDRQAAQIRQHVIDNPIWIA